MMNARFTLVRGKRIKGRHATPEAVFAEAGRMWPGCFVDIEPGDHLRDSRILVYLIGDAIPTAEIVVGPATSLAAPGRGMRAAYTVASHDHGARPKSCTDLEAAIDRVKRGWDGCAIQIGPIGLPDDDCSISVLAPPAYKYDAWGVVASIKRETAANVRHA